MYNTSTQFEYYHNRHALESHESAHLLTHLPVEGPAWYGAALLKLGDLLISTGMKIKRSARATMRLSQETL
jgi:hypothetical protein